MNNSYQIMTIPANLDAGAIGSLTASFESLRHDAAVRSVILTGDGDAFSTGVADQTFSPGEAAEFSRLGQALTSAIDGIGKPVIAAVNGAALGAGLEIALACTWRIASERAEFGFYPTGALPGWGGAVRLSREIGKSRAHELILTCRTINASEALAIGLVNQVLADRDQMMGQAEDLARRIGLNAPIAVKYALEAINSGYGLSIEDGLRLESALFALCFATEDVREGTKAFLEKRSPAFKGR